MAKRKTTKSNKIVDLKPEAKKLTEDQLKNLQTLVRSMDQIHNEMGRMEGQKHNMLHRLAGLTDEMKVMQGELEGEYGKVDIDVVTGEIKESEQVNS